jgi:tRNA threonylcarbamoyladenosine biosynthesis protein TsaB
MTVLAIECSTLVGGIALTRDSRILATESWSRQSSHGEHVVDSVYKVLNKSKITPEQIDLIAVDIGPGRFTGVRVAVNMARGLAYSLEKPVAEFTSLDILAAGCAPQASPVLCLINAHKNMVFAAIYEFENERWKPQTQPQALTLSELEDLVVKPHTCVGDGYLVYEKQFSFALSERLIRRDGISDYPKVEALAQLAAFAQQKSWEDVLPLYIRLSEAEERLKIRPVN